MEQGTRKVIVGAIMSAQVLSSTPAGAGKREAPDLVVYVSDQAGTDPALFDQARSQADRIFNDVGVRPIWREVKEGLYNPGCDGFSVLVTLRSPEMVQRLSLLGMSEKVLGSAASGSDRAFIHPARIQEFASRTRSRAGDLMGRVMAHEIGHLLLPAGHSHYGIMTAGMETEPGLATRFTSPEARVIRSVVEARSAAFTRGENCES